MFLSKRNGIYYLWYRDENGKKQKVSTHSRTKSEALQFLRSFDVPKAVLPKKILLSVFAKEVLEYVRINYAHTTWLIYERSLRLFKQMAGDIPISTVTMHHYDRYKSWRLQTINPTTTNIELRNLRAAFGFAVRWQYLERNPFSQGKLAKLPDVAPAYYSRDDFARLVNAIKEGWFKEIVVFAVLTGMRQAEILNLAWSSVNLETKLLVIESNASFRTKAGKRRTIPLSEDAAVLLKGRLEEKSGEYVFHRFGTRLIGTSVTNKLKKYIRKLGLNDRLNFHAIRHATGSWLAQSGVSIYQISKILGHASVRTTQDFYAHMEAEALREGVNQIRLNGGEKSGQ